MIVNFTYIYKCILCNTLIHAHIRFYTTAYLYSTYMHKRAWALNIVHNYARASYTRAQLGAWNKNSRTTVRVMHILVHNCAHMLYIHT